jgi:hypothetical protein
MGHDERHFTVHRFTGSQHFVGSWLVSSAAM